MITAANCLADVTIGGLNFALSSNKTASLTGAVTTTDTLRIPPTIAIGEEVYTVTSVGKNAFKNVATIKEIFIPSTCQRLENDAFSYMSGLTGVTIEDADTELYVGFQDGVIFDDEMFYSCDKLSSVYIGRNLQWDYNKEGPFQNQKSLSKVTFGPLMTRLGCGFADKKELFYDCKNIKQVVFNGDDSTEPLAIINSTGLDAATVFNINRELANDTADSDIGEMQEMLAHATNVSLGANVKYVHTAMFQNCKALASITIPQNVTEIRSRAFADCTALKYVVLRGTPFLGTEAFAGCTALTRVCTNYDSAPDVPAAASTDCFDAATYVNARLQNTGRWKGALQVLPWSEFGEHYTSESNILHLDTSNDTPLTDETYDQVQISCSVPAETWTLMSLPMLVDSYYFGADAEVLVADSISIDSPFRSSLHFKTYDIDNNPFMPTDQPFLLRCRKGETLIQCGTTDDSFKAQVHAAAPSCDIATSEGKCVVSLCGTFTTKQDDRGRKVNAFSAYLVPKDEIRRIYAKVNGISTLLYGDEPIEGDANDDGEVNVEDAALVKSQLLNEKDVEDVFIEMLQLDDNGTISIRTMTDLIEIIKKRNLPHQNQ